MNKIDERFFERKCKYQNLIEEDFPDFRVEEYAQIKATEIVQSEAPQISHKEKMGKLGSKIFSTIDATGDGNIDASDFAKLSSVFAKKTSSKAKGFGKAAGVAASNFNTTKTFSGAKDVVKEVGKTIASTDPVKVAATAGKIGKTAVGAQGIQDRKASKEIREICSEYYNAAEEVTQEKRQELNYAITDFGEYRLRALHQTVARFLQYLKDLKQNNAVKEYEILSGADIDTRTIDEMTSLDMAASEALKSTAITGAFGAAAVLGTPAAITSAVGALATASTGTAISGLSGAAANSAIMAWLGGGSIAAGGGGMAAGAVTMAAITTGATAAVSILAAGTIVSMHYCKKLTEAKEYEKEVGLAVANLEKAWIVMDGIAKRTFELREVTEELKWRTTGLLDSLEPLIDTFDFANENHVKVFNQCALLVKATVELSQTPLLDNEGNLSSESVNISGKVRKILNTEV